MGNSMTSSYSGGWVYSNWLWGKPPVRMLITGLDAAGKTSILYRLKLGEVITTLPTIGFNVESFQSPWTNGIAVVSWDVGGRSQMRPLWRHYFAYTNYLVFVVDSNDRDRLGQAKDELYFFLNEEGLKGIPLLVFCNKQDLPTALTPSEILQHFFGDHKIKSAAADDDNYNTTTADHRRVSPILVLDRPLWAVGCSVIDGTGLHEGLRWLTAQKMPSMKNVKTATKTYPTKTGAAAAPQDDDPRPVVPSTVTKRSSWLGNDNALGYGLSDSQTNPVLQSFRPIQLGNQCPFAKAAKLWGVKLEVAEAGDDDRNHNVSAAAAVVAEALADFVRRSDQDEPLDGFCLDLGDKAARAMDPSVFGTHVRDVLRVLSDHDPSGERAMRATYIGARGWRFRFARADFFVTTFAPCYPITSSRYAFGTDHAFVLLQPERSFLRHKLPVDTPITQDPPQTIRDKTRLAFRDAGRSYSIPSTTHYPPAEHIVKPLYDDGWTVIRWWETKQEISQDDETKEAAEEYSKSSGLLMSQ